MNGSIAKRGVVKTCVVGRRLSNGVVIAGWGGRGCEGRGCEGRCCERGVMKGEDVKGGYGRSRERRSSEGRARKVLFASRRQRRDKSENLLIWK